MCTCAVCDHTFKAHLILLTPKNRKTTLLFLNHSNSQSHKKVVFCFSVITEQLTFQRCIVLAASSNKLPVLWDRFWGLAIIHWANKRQLMNVCVHQCSGTNPGCCFLSQCEANTPEDCLYPCASLILSMCESTIGNMQHILNLNKYSVSNHSLSSTCCETPVQLLGMMLLQNNDSAPHRIEVLERFWYCADTIM